MPTKATRALGLGAVLLALALPAPAGARAAECAGDECQGPPPAPEEVIPGTAVVEGPSNPTPRFPKSGSGKKHKPKHHHHQQAKKHHKAGKRG
jgi:hypothetical protein